MMTQPGRELPGSPTTLGELGLAERTLQTLLAGGIEDLGGLLDREAEDLFLLEGFDLEAWKDLGACLALKISQDHPAHLSMLGFVASRCSPGLHRPPGGRRRLTVPQLLQRIRSRVRSREWEMLRLYFGLSGASASSFREVDKRFGTTRGTAREVVHRALRRLDHDPALRARTLRLSSGIERRGGWALRSRGLALAGLGSGDVGLLELLARLAGSRVRRTGPRLVVTDLDRVRQFMELRPAAYREVPLPIRLDPLTEWLARRLPVAPRICGRAVRELWRATLLVQGEPPIVVSCGPSPSCADGLAAVLLRLGGEASTDELLKQHARLLPRLSQERPGQWNGLRTDRRFFRAGLSRWTLRSQLPLEETEARCLFSRCAEIVGGRGASLTAHALLRRLQEQGPPPPPWLEPVGLYWLLRDDPRFDTAHFLEVGLAGCGWARPDPWDLLEEVMMALGRPATAEEILPVISESLALGIAGLRGHLADGRRAGRFLDLRGARWAPAALLRIPREAVQKLRRLARERAEAVRDVVWAKDPGWRPGTEHLSADEVDVALWGDPGLGRVARGGYLPVERVEASRHLGTEDLIVAILEERGRALHSTHLIRLLAERGRCATVPLLSQITGREGRVVRYPYLHRTWLGLRAWGPAGYRSVVEQNWEAVVRVAREFFSTPWRTADLPPPAWEVLRDVASERDTELALEIHQHLQRHP